jgi:hypothetical protein|tara:strand:- start:1486 stop:1620 length:135 start_codon:yes stop_codon:yes gene_type:complete
MPNKPEKVFGAGIGNFNNAKTTPNDKPVISDKIDCFMDITFTLI